MPISRKTWLTFVLLAVASFFIWRTYTYPQLAFIDLSVDRPQALQIARDYLTTELGADPDDYHSSTIFHVSTEADRFLQRALGPHGAIRFFEEHESRLFFWMVRFFRNGEKEEYHLSVSARDGKVIKTAHIINDTDARPDLGEDAARQQLQDFLAGHFGWDFSEWQLHNDAVNKHDNRTDYTFNWEKTGVAIPWSDNPDAGEGKLLTGGTVSGGEILYFYRYRISIPDAFSRQIARLTDQGQNISSLVRLLYMVLLAFAVFQVMVRRSSLVMHSVKRFCITVTGLLFLCHVTLILNDNQQILFHYPTSSSLQSYLWQLTLNYLPTVFLATIGVLMPGLAGETLRYEVLPQQPAGGFLYYLRTTLWTRRTAALIVLGYLTAMIMAGIQAFAFEWGQRYWGVWVEHSWISHLSSGSFPMLSALCLALIATFSEEIGYRIFGISLGKKYLRHAGAAVLAASLLWGFGHTFYPVYPMWFRGVEVSLIGIFLGMLYLRYGIIPLLTAHFVFDVFWLTAAYLFGRADVPGQLSALGLILLPLGIAALAYRRNQMVCEKALSWRLNQRQEYNLGILRHYLTQDSLPEKSTDEWKTQLLDLGWDIAVIERALDERRPGDEEAGGKLEE